MKIVALCTLSTGLNAIEYAIKLGISIDKIIGLNPKNLQNKKSISGYIDIKNFCKKYKGRYSLGCWLAKINPRKLYIIPKNLLNWSPW